MAQLLPDALPEFALLDWGRLAYRDALARQHALVGARNRDEIPDTLVLVEHDSIVTMGRGAAATNVLDPAADTIAIERGGDVTWHGPGQLVGYVIRRLDPPARDLHAHLRLLEEIVIRTVAAFGITGARLPAKTGVWVTPAGAAPLKLASLGVAARNWITYHGFALNVCPDLAAFAAIRPCGFDAGVMTSMAALTAAPITLDGVRAALRGVLASPQ